MVRLRVPSLQHLARNWCGDARGVKWKLIELAKNAPTFNYNPLFGAVRDMLVFGQSRDQVAEGIRRGIRRPDVRDNFLEVLPLIDRHFSEIRPDFVQAVDCRYYAVGRNLLIPFEPPLVYGLAGQFFCPWFSFWRSNPLGAERLSLFVTIVEEMLQQDADLETARFDILDFSRPRPGRPRELSVLDSRDVPRVSESRKLEMLSIFAEGYFLATAELARPPEKWKPDASEPDVKDGDQNDLFDPST